MLMWRRHEGSALGQGGRCTTRVTKLHSTNLHRLMVLWLELASWNLAI